MKHMQRPIPWEFQAFSENVMLLVLIKEKTPEDMQLT